MRPTGKGSLRQAPLLVFIRKSCYLEAFFRFLPERANARFFVIKGPNLRSIAKSDVEQKFIEMAERVLGPLGFRVVDVDAGVGPRSLVRLFVDWADPTRRIGLDDCAEVSRHLDPFVDTFEAMPGGFTLEVSSPGLDRRLRLQSDFQSALGKDVRLKLSRSKEGFGSKPWGTVCEVGEEDLVFSQNKQVFRVPWSEIRQAHLMWKGD